MFSNWTIEGCRFDLDANKSTVHAISVSGVTFTGNAISGGSSQPFVFVGSDECDFSHDNACHAINGQGSPCPRVAREDCSATDQGDTDAPLPLESDDGAILGPERLLKTDDLSSGALSGAILYLDFKTPGLALQLVQLDLASNTTAPLLALGHGEAFFAQVRL